MNFKSILELLKETYADWNEDKAPRLGAALAYYTVFAMAPMLLIIMAVIGLVFDNAGARALILDQIHSFVDDPKVAEMVGGMIDNASHRDSGIWPTIVGIVMALFGAAGLFGQLQDALNTIWEVAPKPGQGFMAMVKNRFLSFTMVLGTGFLLLVSFVLSAALAAFGNFMGGYLPEAVLHVLNFVVSFGVITLLFAMIYKVLPDVEIAWRDVWMGAAMTSLLFTIGKFALGMYLGRSGATSAYGAAGSLVLILLWIYYAAQILFFGAEFTQIYATKYGSRIEPSPNAVPVTEEARAKQGMPRQEVVAATAQQSDSGSPPAPGYTPPATPPKSGNAMEDLAPILAGFGAVLLFKWLRRSKD
ncbi:MAG TPA: YihY/virulence factor BrkB family protein [Abditibacteriaceae bacterium]|nr:YihY/virulence factor BrkB family protein [Abditibacteriaceae bacterium]